MPDLSTTMIYTHIVNEELEDAFEILSPSDGGSSVRRRYIGIADNEAGAMKDAA